jgi:hypothetical protein
MKHSTALDPALLAKLTPDERARVESDAYFRGFVETCVELEGRGLVAMRGDDLIAGEAVDEGWGDPRSQR